MHDNSNKVLCKCTVMMPNTKTQKIQSLIFNQCTTLRISVTIQTNHFVQDANVILHIFLKPISPVSQPSSFNVTAAVPQKYFCAECQRHPAQNIFGINPQKISYWFLVYLVNTMPHPNFFRVWGPLDSFLQNIIDTMHNLDNINNRNISNNTPRTWRCTKTIHKNQQLCTKMKIIVLTKTKQYVHNVDDGMLKTNAKTFQILSSNTSSSQKVSNPTNLTLLLSMPSLTLCIQSFGCKSIPFLLDINGL